MINEFIEICNMAGGDIDLVQGTGGNISFKENNLMYIKSSGFSLKDVNEQFGYTVVKFDEISKYIKSQNSHDSLGGKKEAELTCVLESSKINKDFKRASMESGFHSFMPRCVVHLHPIYLNVFLCMKNGFEQIKYQFEDIDYEYIDYFSPGYNLSYSLSNIKPSKEVYFLSNHGIIVSGDSLEKCYLLIKEINNQCKDILMKNSFFESYKVYNIKSFNDDKFFYPDSIVFLNKETLNPTGGVLENICAHKYIKDMASKLGRLKVFEDNQVEYIMNMEAEKYRKSLV